MTWLNQYPNSNFVWLTFVPKYNDKSTYCRSEDNARWMVRLSSRWTWQASVTYCRYYPRIRSSRRLTRQEKWIHWTGGSWVIRKSVLNKRPKRDTPQYLTKNLIPAARKQQHYRLKYHGHVSTGSYLSKTNGTAHHPATVPEPEPNSHRHSLSFPHSAD